MNIKITLIFILCSLLKIANAQRKDGYKITGNITGIPEGTAFFLVKSNNGLADTVAWTKSKQGRFTFEGILDKEGEHHFIKMDTTNIKLPHRVKSYVTVFLDNSNLSLTGTVFNWPLVDMQGSIPTLEYEQFLVLDQQHNITEKFLEEWRGNGSDTTTLREAQNKYGKFLLEYAAEHPNSYVSPYCIFNASRSLNLAAIKETYDNLSFKVKSSFYGEKLKERISTLKNKSALLMGRTIPDFYVETLSREQNPIKSVIGKSKLTLIDFWAWWCTPCRKDIHNMKKVYNDFHSKGFNIISISTDRNREKWQKAVAEDDTPWSQVMEVGNASAIIFDIKSLPAYILINEKGEILVIDCSLIGLQNALNADQRLAELNKAGLRQNLYKVISELLETDL